MKEQILVWPETYYRETDRQKRKLLLEEHGSTRQDPADSLRMELWELRYQRRKGLPEGVDFFIRSWMELYFISKKPGKIHRKSHLKTLEQVKKDLGFSLAGEYGDLGEEVLYQELCNGIRLYVELCRRDSKYNSALLGILKLKPERLIQKIAGEFWQIAVEIPEKYGMEEEFAVFRRACGDVFREEFPEAEKIPGIREIR